MKIIPDPKGFGERYFAEEPGKKVYAVDAYMTLCKCFKVEAADADEAEAKVKAKIIETLRNCEETDIGHKLSDMGFGDAEEMDVNPSGEADENGDINYY